MAIPCSVCILTYNSARTLGRTLESVKDCADLVVVDGGSTDETLTIARQFGARIFPQREDGATGQITDFTAVRARSFTLAREPWRLWLDSDEWLSLEAHKIVEDIVAHGDPNALYALSRKAVIAGRVVEYAYFYPEYCKRLFHRDGDVFLKKGKKVHEDLVAGPRATVKKIPAVIFHEWREQYRDLIQKDRQYLALTVAGKEGFARTKKMRIAFVNVLKGVRVLVRSMFIYLRHGFRRSLSPTYVWRFARYHFLYAKKIL